MIFVLKKLFEGLWRELLPKNEALAWILMNAVRERSFV